MSHTYAQNVIHLVFSTKGRRKTISANFQPKLWANSAGICKKQGIFVHATGGMEDHAHFLIQVPPVMALFAQDTRETVPPLAMVSGFESV